MRIRCPSLSGVTLALSITLVASTGCTDEVSPPEATASAGSAQGGGSSGRVEIDATALDAYARGLNREIAAVRDAQQRSAKATTPAERGEAIQAAFETSTIPLGAEAAGLPLERYRTLREAVHDVFETLDFQGKIDGPLSMDLSRASQATKQRLSRDAFADLPESSATALRGRMNELVPIWIEYVRLTAVAG